jgi:hypothetical protein
MAADELAARLGVSRRYIFKLKTKHPTEAPEFSDVGAWCAFIEAKKPQVQSPHKVAGNRDAGCELGDRKQYFLRRVADQCSRLRRLRTLFALWLDEPSRRTGLQA